MRVFDSDSIKGLNFLPRSVVIVGGGIIAVEFARIFAALDAKVTTGTMVTRCYAFLRGDEGGGCCYTAVASQDDDTCHSCYSCYSCYSCHSCYSCYVYSCYSCYTYHIDGFTVI